jgi:hypothetical protein
MLSKYAFAGAGHLGQNGLSARVRPASSPASMFGSLFSEAYGKENNCTSGIAMFFEAALMGPAGLFGRANCHY